MINRRQITFITLIAILALLLMLIFVTIFMGNDLIAPDFSSKNLPPSWQHPFGTDWLGRDMLARTVKGLSLSVLIGIIASFFSAVLAVILGTMAAAMPKPIGSLINWIIDLNMGMPHIVLMILISFAVGRGVLGIIIGISATHWVLLARILRAEVLVIKSEPYVAVSKKLGKSSSWVMVNHFLPHLLPQFLVGIVLLFPHAILHEAAITFLGFGLSPEEPAIGVILSESMRYLNVGYWWLAFFPGVILVSIVLLIDKLGEDIKSLTDPFIANK